MKSSDRIFVAGHRGLVGSAIVWRLHAEGASTVLTATRDQLDLRDQAAVNYWFRANRPEYAYLVAGSFTLEVPASTLATASSRCVKKTCSAARSNQRRGVCGRQDCGIKLRQGYRRQYGADFISAMPTNLYGPDDNFDLTSSHVLPAMIRKFHDAKVRNDRTVQIWGTGRPRREFLHVKDVSRRFSVTGGPAGSTA